jgi:hypothetical protein
MGVDMRTDKIKFPRLFGSRTLASSPSAISLIITFLALAFAAPARAQESQPPAESVVQAARNARERIAASTKHPKIITNADLGVPSSEPAASAFDLHFSSTYGDEPSNPPAADCDNPYVARLTMKLQVAEQELEELRRELSYEPPVISNGDLDLEYFKPGYSGLYVGSPPLLETEPPVPARVGAVELEQRIASLTKALRIACEPPEAARIQWQLDEAEKELDLLQREFALDQDTYYSNPDYVEDREGEAWLNDDQQQIDYLKSEIERLRQNLAVLNTP